MIYRQVWISYFHLIPSSFWICIFILVSWQVTAERTLRESCQTQRSLKSKFIFLVAVSGFSITPWKFLDCHAHLLGICLCRARNYTHWMEYVNIYLGNISLGNIWIQITFTKYVWSSHNPVILSGKLIYLYGRTAFFHNQADSLMWNSK